MIMVSFCLLRQHVLLTNCQIWEDLLAPVSYQSKDMHDCMQGMCDKQSSVVIKQVY